MKSSGVYLRLATCCRPWYGCMVCCVPSAEFFGSTSFACFIESFDLSHAGHFNSVTRFPREQTVCLDVLLEATAMFAPSPRSTPAARRRRQHGRAAMPLTRSGSILNSLKSFVSAPLAWFGSNDEGVDDLGKRRRSDSKDIEDVEEDRPSQGRTKRARVDDSGAVHPSVQNRIIPSSSSGYLDPPSSSFQSTRSDANAGKDASGSFMQHSSMFAGLPSSMSRTMSIDPPTSYSSSRLLRDPSTLSLSSPIEPRSSMSLMPGSHLVIHRLVH